jgi:large subunit ribosomal protein L6
MVEMSRIGKKPVAIPSGVTATVKGSEVIVKGPKGELRHHLPPSIQAVVANGQVVLTSSDPTAQGKSFYGLTRTLVANMATGVTAGYAKELELQGVGFRAAVQGSKLTLTIGFSSPVEFTAPAGITVQVKETFITISGADKQMVGDTAARIRSIYPPEPYKGKGIRYRGEHVRRKAGKTVA